MCFVVYIYNLHKLHVSTVERCLEVRIYLLIKVSFNRTIRRATKKLKIERKWWKIVAKKNRRNGETSQKRRDGGVGVIGKCSDSSIVQEALCTNTKDDSPGLEIPQPQLAIKANPPL